MPPKRQDELERRLGMMRSQLPAECTVVLNRVVVLMRLVRLMMQPSGRASTQVAANARTLHEGLGGHHGNCRLWANDPEGPRHYRGAGQPASCCPAPRRAHTQSSWWLAPGSRRWTRRAAACTGRAAVCTRRAAACTRRASREEAEDALSCTGGLRGR